MLAIADVIFTGIAAGILYYYVRRYWWKGPKWDASPRSPTSMRLLVTGSVVLVLA
ncbi:MAG: hypothetical protein ACRD3D_17730 [Terriglobia bacterium]